MRVDVVVPNYNKAPYIREALLSILRQKTDKIASIIVCDDGSTDHSLDEVRQMQAEYPGRVTLIKQLRNVGGCRNTAFAFNQGTAEFVACLDADDTWDNENKVELMVAAFDTYPELLVCTSMWSNTNMAGELFTPDISKYYPDKFYRLSTQDLLSTPAVFGTISFHPNLIMMRRIFSNKVFSNPYNEIYFKSVDADSLRYAIYHLNETEKTIGMFTDPMATLRTNETSITTYFPQLMLRTHQLLYHCKYRELYQNNITMNRIFDLGIAWLRPRFIEELDKAIMMGDQQVIDRAYQTIIAANNYELIEMFDLYDLFGEKKHVKFRRDVRRYGIAGYGLKRFKEIKAVITKQVMEFMAGINRPVMYILVRIPRIPKYIKRWVR